MNKKDKEFIQNINAGLLAILIVEITVFTGMYLASLFIK